MWGTPSRCPLAPWLTSETFLCLRSFYSDFVSSFLHMEYFEHLRVPDSDHQLRLPV